MSGVAAFRIGVGGLALVAEVGCLVVFNRFRYELNQNTIKDKTAASMMRVIAQVCFIVAIAFAAVASGGLSGGFSFFAGKVLHAIGIPLAVAMIIARIGIETTLLFGHIYLFRRALDTEKEITQL